MHRLAVMSPNLTDQSRSDRAARAGFERRQRSIRLDFPLDFSVAARRFKIWSFTIALPLIVGHGNRQLSCCGQIPGAIPGLDRDRINTARSCTGPFCAQA